QATDVLEGKAQVGERVVVIGGELVGCETAEYLAEKGRKVTVTRRGPEMATGVGPMLRSFFLDRLEKLGVTLLTGVTYNEVVDGGLVVSTSDGKTRTIEADTIVLAAGATPEQRLRKEIEGSVAEIHLVGDCAQPRTVREAIADGYAVGLAI
ncbi:MAG: FAD-dependent oxidoreductase, partial [Dehalococcoidia bacterium]|nr:FAD-dependent oxidoreductase [Dehalococcoidia bacterium]